MDGGTHRSPHVIHVAVLFTDVTDSKSLLDFICYRPAALALSISIVCESPMHHVDANVTLSPLTPGLIGIVVINVP